MPSIQVKNVPDDVHETLRRRAAQEGRSLQEYLLRRLVDEARHPTIDELFARLSGLQGGSFTLAEAADIVRDDRERH